MTNAKHRNTSRRRMLTAAGEILAAAAVTAAAVVGADVAAHASTVPHAHAATCRAFGRWYTATEGGYRYAGYRWMVRRMERHAERADAPLWGDVWALAQVAPLAEQWQSPEQQRAGMALIGDAAAAVALDCSIRLGG